MRMLKEPYNAQESKSAPHGLLYYVSAKSWKCLQYSIVHLQFKYTYTTKWDLGLFIENVASLFLYTPSTEKINGDQEKESNVSPDPDFPGDMYGGEDRFVTRTLV